MDRMKRMVREIEKQPGIQSAKLARKLGISSLECAALARRLSRRGFVTIGHQNRMLTYTLSA
jgi:Mn-dependent DtxR family transcriptional regulator